MNGLPEILESHRRWLDGEDGGEQANLNSANLTGANLAGTNLKGARLMDANLQDGNLRGANLQGAKLFKSVLERADLTGADLTGAGFENANLREAILCDARLAGASFSGACLADADFSGAIWGDDVPFIKDLDRKVARMVGADGRRLNMHDWHSSCGTKHCRAGWAIEIAGKPGKALEGIMGPGSAAAAIYARSTGRVPDFHCSNAEALADIMRCATVYGDPSGG